MPRKKTTLRTKKSMPTTVHALFRDLFVPHPGNNHKPHALRPKALLWYGGFLIAIKVVATLVLFFSYPTPALNQVDMRKEFMAITNSSRESLALRPLISHDELMRAAQAKADDMMIRGYFDHITPEGASPGSFIHSAAYRYRSIGENLAIDFSSASSAHTALMNSPSHRANMLHPRFVHVGIGVSTGEFQGRTTNIVVELFASPAPSPQVLGAHKSSWFTVPLFSISSWRDSIKSWVKRIYLAVLVYLCLSLLLAVVMRMRILRTSVVMHAAGLIVLIMIAAVAEHWWYSPAGEIVKIL